MDIHLDQLFVNAKLVNELLLSIEEVRASKTSEKTFAYKDLTFKIVLVRSLLQDVRQVLVVIEKDNDAKSKSSRLLNAEKIRKEFYFLCKQFNKNSSQEEFEEFLCQLKSEGEQDSKKVEQDVFSKKSIEEGGSDTERIHKEWDIYFLGCSHDEVASLSLGLLTWSGIVGHDLAKHLVRQLQADSRKSGNPFHNACHGLVVAHSAHVLLQKLEFKVDEVEHATLMLAALGHNLGHTGCSNAIEVESMSTLAIRYNDRSVLEQHSLALLLSLLNFREKGDHAPTLNEGLTPHDQRRVKRLLVKMVLATDTSRVQSFLLKANDELRLRDNSMILILLAADCSDVCKDWEAAL
jgi:hypothetical protein